jgi:hypothetical protein
MRSSKWQRILGTVLAVGLLALLSVPAQAGHGGTADNDRIFPEGWSIVFSDVFAFQLECIDFVPCSGAKCPAVGFFTGEVGTYTDVTTVRPKGRMQTTVVFQGPHVFGGIEQNKKTVLDLHCSKRGVAVFAFPGGIAGPGSCGAEVTHFPQNSVGGPARHEGLAGLTIAGFGVNGGGTCAQFFISKDARENRDAP